MSVVNEKIDIKSLDIEELKELLVSLGEKSFRAAQIFDWLHNKLVYDFDDMTNLSSSLRDKLKEIAYITDLKIEKELISTIDGTRKYLFGLYDDNIIESVLMRYEHGLSVCISSQVGCRMGCRFCASTIDGLVRNLNPSEMLDQIYKIEKRVGERVGHIVIMGSGEPLDNFDNFIRFVKLISDEKGQNLSRRNITVSTCGLVPKIYELADLDLKITLAASLHAPNDTIRRQTMPIANKYSIDEILKACSYFLDKTGRRITFEYSLIKGVNDSKENALELGRRVKPLGAHINLIPVNPVKERDYEQSVRADIDTFKNTLEKEGVNATIRREMGRDISGACGQLRRSYKNENCRS